MSLSLASGRPLALHLLHLPMREMNIHEGSVIQDDDSTNDVLAGTMMDEQTSARRACCGYVCKQGKHNGDDVSSMITTAVREAL